MTTSLFVRRSLAALCALAAQLCLARAGRAQQSLAPILFPPEDEVEASDEAYRRGNAASHDKHWADAYEAYRQAWSHNHAMKVAANLGNLELTEGRNRDAAEHLGFAVYAYPKDGDPGVLATLKERLASARAKVGTLHVTVAGCAQANVFVDGVRLGMSIDDAIFVEPGTRTVEAKWEGCRTARQAIDIASGTTRELPLDMTTRAPVAAPPPPIAPPEEPRAEQREKSAAALRLGFGGAVAAAGVGVGLALLADSYASAAADDRKAILGSYGPGACASPSGQAAIVCGQLSSVVSSQTTYTNVAIGSFIAAGVLALGTGAYAVWPEGDKARRATRGVHLEPLVTGDRRGLAAVGSF
jgi:hypothetical protein